VRALGRRCSDEREPYAPGHRRDDSPLRTAFGDEVVKRGTSFVHGLEVVDSIMKKTRAAAVGLTMAATIAAVTVPMPGSAVAGPPIEHFTKAEPQVPYRPSTAPVERLAVASSQALRPSDPR
jgi:hypothetical protein